MRNKSFSWVTKVGFDYLCCIREISGQYFFDNFFVMNIFLLTFAVLKKSVLYGSGCIYSRSVDREEGISEV